MQKNPTTCVTFFPYRAPVEPLHLRYFLLRTRFKALPLWGLGPLAVPSLVRGGRWLRQDSKLQFSILKLQPNRGKKHRRCLGFLACFMVSMNFPWLINGLRWLIKAWGWIPIFFIILGTFRIFTNTITKPKPIFKKYYFCIYQHFVNPFFDKFGKPGDTEIDKRNGGPNKIFNLDRFEYKRKIRWWYLDKSLISWNL